MQSKFVLSGYLVMFNLLYEDAFMSGYGINDEASSAHLDLRNLVSLFSRSERHGGGESCLKVGKSQFDCLYVAKKSFLRC